MILLNRFVDKWETHFLLAALPTGIFLITFFLPQRE